MYKVKCILLRIIFFHIAFLSFMCNSLAHDSTLLCNDKKVEICNNETFHINSKKNADMALYFLAHCPHDVHCLKILQFFCQLETFMDEKGKSSFWKENYKQLSSEYEYKDAKKLYEKLKKDYFFNSNKIFCFDERSKPLHNYLTDFLRTFSIYENCLNKEMIKFFIQINDFKDFDMYDLRILNKIKNDDFRLMVLKEIKKVFTPIYEKHKIFIKNFSLTDQLIIKALQIYMQEEKVESKKHVEKITLKIPSKGNAEEVFEKNIYRKADDLERILYAEFIKFIINKYHFKHIGVPEKKVYCEEKKIWIVCEFIDKDENQNFDNLDDNILEEMLLCLYHSGYCDSNLFNFVIGQDKKVYFIDTEKKSFWQNYTRGTNEGLRKFIGKFNGIKRQFLEKVYNKLINEKNFLLCPEKSAKIYKRKFMQWLKKFKKHYGCPLSEKILRDGLFDDLMESKIEIK